MVSKHKYRIYTKPRRTANPAVTPQTTVATTQTRIGKPTRLPATIPATMGTSTRNIGKARNFSLRVSLFGIGLF